MSAHRRVVAAPAVVGVLAGLVGCTSGSTKPVPTIAEEPFVCDGVPLDGVRLITPAPTRSNASRPVASGAT